MTETKIDNEAKEKIFRFPGQDFTGFGRKLSCVSDSRGMWIAAQMETADTNTIIIIRKTSNDICRIQLPRGPFYHNPCLFPLKDGEIGLLDLLRKTNLASSNGEARRLVQQNAVSIDGVKVSDPNHRLNVAIWAPFVLKVGKRRFARVIV